MEDVEARIRVSADQCESADRESTERDRLETDRTRQAHRLECASHSGGRGIDHGEIDIARFAGFPIGCQQKTAEQA